jgi:hypothetical protein
MSAHLWLPLADAVVAAFAFRRLDAGSPSPWTILVVSPGRAWPARDSSKSWVVFSLVTGM